MGQNSIEYISKCRMYHSLTKSTCEKLTLNNDMTFQYILGYSSDLPIISNGKYSKNKDTIITVDNDILRTLEISRLKNNITDLFVLKFVDIFNNSVKVDSIKLFGKEKVFKIYQNVGSVDFYDADSIRFYLLGQKFIVRTDLNDYKLTKSISIVLPVNYYIIKDSETIIGYYTKNKYKKINVP